MTCIQQRGEERAFRPKQLDGQRGPEAGRVGEQKD